MYLVEKVRLIAHVRMKKTDLFLKNNRFTVDNHFADMGKCIIAGEKDPSADGVT
ncbi:MAG: hypothetical protein ACP5M4_00405 [Acidobacteriaceae bacterium]